MQDAFGGLLSMGIIIFFLVLVSGILGFTYSYAKAFRMKDYVISTFEQYDALGCTDGIDTSDDTACKNLIRQKANQLAYNTNMSCRVSEGEEKGINGLFCYKRKDINGRLIYEITTQVNIEIPIINNLFGLKIFQVHGSTRELKNFN